MKASSIRFMIIALFVQLVLFSKAQAQQCSFVSIGDLNWCTKNLDVWYFRNGDSIPQACTNEEWDRAIKEGKPAWCFYDNDPKNDEIYGKLYNWYAISDPRGLAPIGLRIPTEIEWLSLMSQLAGYDMTNLAGSTSELEESASPLMSINGWDELNNSNEIGFSALPGGYKMSGGFYGKGRLGLWWSTTSYDDFQSIHFLININQEMLGRMNMNNEGYSVRCVEEDL
jgi:uncharacterized protein (TIGR02145 family)